MMFYWHGNNTLHMEKECGCSAQGTWQFAHAAVRMRACNHGQPHLLAERLPGQDGQWHTTRSADASRAMALRLSPPLMRASRAFGAALSTAFARRAAKRTALPLSSAMLIPECPPIKPAEAQMCLDPCNYP